MATTAPVVLATWNLHAGVGTDGHFDLDRIAEEIRRVRPDVIALQEVDAYRTRSQSVNMWRSLGHRTGLAAFFGPTLVGPEPSTGSAAPSPTRPIPQYGNAVLTRLAPRAVENHRLSGPEGAEPRGCLEVVFDTWTCLVTHWGLDAAERRAQCEDVADMVSRADASGRPAAVLGDLNAVRVSPEIERLRGLRLDAGAGAGATFPAPTPTRRIDYVFLPPTWRVAGAEVVNTVASDHLPLVVTVLPPPGTGT